MESNLNMMMTKCFTVSNYLFFFMQTIRLLWQIHPRAYKNLLMFFLEYCKTWQLTINYDKTKVLIFGIRKRNAFKFMMEGNEIEQVTNYRYLGVIMSNNGSFFLMQEKVSMTKLIRLCTCFIKESTI